jgi:hypothetical protein
MGEKFEFWVNWTERANFLTKDLGNVRCNACANDFLSDLQVRASVYENAFESDFESVFESDFESVFESDWIVDNLECDIKFFQICGIKY